MWFKRMSLEDWFDTWQYRTRYDVGESAVKFLKVGDLALDLSEVELRYGHHRGHPQLRALVAEEYPPLTPDEMIVTSGAAEAIFSVAAALVGPDDHVVVEHPNYPSTYDVPRGLGCDVSLLPLRFEDAFKPDLDRLTSMVTSRTKLIVFTHPNNPTGSMISTDELEALVGFAESRRVHLLFDETYRHLSFGAPLPPAALLSPWAISVTSMSKCYGLPGIRMGWLATRSQIVLDGVLAVREQVTITNTALSEAIALSVLSRREDFLERARTHVATNFAIVRDWMATQGRLEWVMPEGGVVALPRFREDALEGDPEHLYRQLAEDQEVFVVPGRCFEVDNRHFRLGFGGTSDELRTGLGRIGAVLEHPVVSA